MIEVVGIDGDDTLWHNESIFSVTQERFREILRHAAGDEEIDRRLHSTEMANLKVFGYGIKGFTLSMIETALEITHGQIGGADIGRIVEAGKAMLGHPIQLLDGAAQVVEQLSRSGRRLMLVTKGDLFDQESKIARSGLADAFWRVEILTEKEQAAYRRLLSAHEIPPERFLMAGNSLRSDVLPVIAIGAHAAHVPYHLTWAHEFAEPTQEQSARYTTLGSISELPDLVDRLDSGYLPATRR